MVMYHQPLIFKEDFRKFNAASIESQAEESRSSFEKIKLALLYENAPAFVELINNLPSDELQEDYEYILSLLVLWDSGKCGAAVLDGQTKISEIPLATSSIAQLHHTAALGAPKMTALLLERGFSADVRCDYDRTTYIGNLENVLPLHVVMGCLHHVLSPLNANEETPATMLAKLCGSKYRRPLETLRMIALNMNTTEVKREFFNYLKEGKLIEVSALLLVAKSKILSPSTPNGEEGELQSILEIIRFVGKTELISEEAKRRKIDLLWIFNDTGDKLAALLRLDFAPTCLAHCSTLLAASVIENARFLSPVNHLFYDYKYTCSQDEYYHLKGAIDACEKTIRATPTSDMMPIWVKEAALTGLCGKPGRHYSRLTYPFVSNILPFANMPLLHRLMNNTAPFLGMIKKAFRLP